MSLDLGFLPSSTRATDVQVFNRAATVTNTQWLSWLRPRGVVMSHIICIGGGGGGGGGLTGIAGAARGGGGGGGGSGITVVTGPCLYWADQLYVQVGGGGQGNTSGGAGTAGVLSYVSIAPDITASNIIAVSGAAAAGGGAAGAATGNAAGGVASTIALIGAMPLSGLSQSQMIAGQVGSTGGLGTTPGAVGTAQSIPVTSTMCTGGSGGAATFSTNLAGGLFTAIAASYLSEQRPATPAAGVAGPGGPQMWEPLFGFGGTGGGSNNAAAGTAGGTGAYGAGGGGGGGGTTGGRGGNGGSGLVIIISW